MSICRSCAREQCACMPADMVKAIKESLADSERQRQNEQAREEAEYKDKLSAEGAEPLTAFEVGILRRLIRRETDRDAAVRVQQRAQRLMAGLR